MFFKKIRTLFLNEPGNVVFKENVIANISSQITPDVSSVAIKTNLGSVLSYPFSTSMQVLEQLIKVLRSQYKGKIYIIDSGNGEITFQTIENRLRTIISNYDVTLIDVENTQLQEFSHQSYRVAVPKIWFDADLRICLTTIFTHVHHLDKAYHGLIAQLIGLVPRSCISFVTKTGNTRSILADGFDEYVKAVEQNLHTLTMFALVDSRLVGMSNEHSFFLRAQKSDRIDFVRLSKENDKVWCEKAGLLYYPSYLE